MLERLIDAAIAVVASEEGAFQKALGRREAQLYESWPEMDELMAALDEAAPDWRDRLWEEEAAGA
jgi:hypothetical protein